MEQGYGQLSLEERCAIASLRSEGHSVRQIAADLDRSPSTISREVRRNSGRQAGYKPSYAQEQTRARRWKGSRLERNTALREEVLACLRKGWSPETGLRLPGATAWPPRDLAGEHLPLHRGPDCPPQGLSLAALSAARQEQARLPGAQGRIIGASYRSPCSYCRKARHRRRPLSPGPLGSRPHDVRQIRPGDPHPA